MNPIRAHIERRGTEVVRPTERLVRYWWLRIMREGFGYSRLHRELRPATIDVRRQDAEWACLLWPDPEDLQPHLAIFDGEISRRGLLALLAHECIHAILTHESRHPDDQHGASFMDYARLVEEVTGLPLRDTYSPEELT